MFFFFAFPAAVECDLLRPVWVLGLLRSFLESTVAGSPLLETHMSQEEVTEHAVARVSPQRFAQT